MSDFITKLEEQIARKPDTKVAIDIRVNTENAPLKAIKKSIGDEYKDIISMNVITHGKPTQGQPELVGDGKIVVIRIEKLASDHLKYLKRGQESND